MKIKGPVVAILLLFTLFWNTILWCTLLYCFALLKLLPIKPLRSFSARCATACARSWSSINKHITNFVLPTRSQVTGLNELFKKKWYLVLSNHQSWLDIMVLQNVFLGKIPFFKFFLKNELKWVPLLGLAWMGLDYPFMKRYSKEFIKKNPHLTGKDLETTKRSCAKFKKTPTTIMNFVEGTRFSTEKKQLQDSPYDHLLRPRAGGLAYVLSAMGEQLDAIIDVTIVYPNKVKSLWDYLCGRVDSICVNIRTIDITPSLLGDYFSDKDYQLWFRDWMNERWSEKDKLISAIQAAYVSQSCVG